MSIKTFLIPSKQQQDSLDQDEKVDSLQSSEIAQISEIRFTPSQPGSVKCRARNHLGSASETGQVKLGDIAQPFMISGLRDEQKIAIGDFIRLECGAIIYNYSSDIKWRKDGEPVENISDLVVEDANTKFSWRKTITWKQITKEDEGVYDCEVAVRGSEDLLETRQVAIAVHDAQSPVITSNFNQSVMQQTLGSSLRLDCLVSGLPVPSLLWYKNDEIFVIEEVASDDNSMQRIMLDNSNSSITFSVLKLEDAGTYKCVTWNRVGSDFKEVQLEIPSKSIDLQTQTDRHNFPLQRHPRTSTRESSSASSVSSLS